MEQPIFEIKEEKTKGNTGKIVISPLASGYGHTLGVALRRVLLTSLPGAALTKVKIAGVKHQFSTLKGMREDVLDFLLNLKQVKIAYTGTKPVKLTLSINKAGEVKASDIKAPAEVKLTNPDLVLATLAKGAKLEATLEAEAGVGYSPAEDRTASAIGTIPLDATFSPVERVDYKVEETRVGRLTNYDKLTLEVTTDGGLSPKEAVLEAAKILVSYFNQIVTPQKAKKTEKVETREDFGATGKLSVEEIGLPTRVANALINAGYETVDKVVKADPKELVKVRNFGEKSLKIMRIALAEKGVEI